MKFFKCWSEDGGEDGGGKSFDDSGRVGWEICFMMALQSDNRIDVYDFKVTFMTENVIFFKTPVF